MFPRAIRDERAFALIGILALLVVLAVAASIAIQSLEPALDETKRVETDAEMDQIAQAVAGEYRLAGSLSGSEFGYVGDVGALPTSLASLTSNPGGYSTWNGPYIRDNFHRIKIELKKYADALCGGNDATIPDPTDFTATFSNGDVINFTVIND